MRRCIRDEDTSKSVKDIRQQRNVIK